MPMYTNGVYQDHSVPGLKNVGVGTGVANSGQKDGGMGGTQNQPGYPSSAMSIPKGNDGCSNKTYSK